MQSNGKLAVHQNVTFEANTALQDGGAVSFPLEVRFNPFLVLYVLIGFSMVGLICLEIGSRPSGVVCFDSFFESWFDLQRHLTKRRRKG